jgi:pimeloyl-ACP methyl ester carboxylesterase
VGHSYGGVVITEAGNHPSVAALVYVAAFAPDKGESVSSLIANPHPGAPVPPILPPQVDVRRTRRCGWGPSWRRNATASGCSART